MVACTKRAGSAPQEVAVATTEHLARIRRAPQMLTRVDLIFSWGAAGVLLAKGRAYSDALLVSCPCLDLTPGTFVVSW